jgi:hypothetical protein
MSRLRFPPYYPPPRSLETPAGINGLIILDYNKSISPGFGSYTLNSR